MQANRRRRVRLRVQAMQTERAIEEARTLRAAAAAVARCCTARTSVMPYRAYWANKVAI